METKGKLIALYKIAGVILFIHTLSDVLSLPDLPNHLLSRTQLRQLLGTYLVPAFAGDINELGDLIYAPAAAIYLGS